MEDLELGGNVPLDDESPKEPAGTTQETDTIEITKEECLHAWSGYTPTWEPPAQKVSPFANSPYMTVTPMEPASPSEDHVPFAVPYTNGQDPEAPQGKKRSPRQRPKRSVLPLISLLLSVGVLAILLVVCLVNNYRFSDLTQQYKALLNNYNQQNDQIELLEDQLAAAQRPQNPDYSQLAPATSDTPVRVPAATGVMTPAQVYARCVPSVVAIKCTSVAYNNFGPAAQATSSGSGFILSEDGYIVTNYHVVGDSSSIEICLHDGTTYQAEYIGGNETNDIALIKVNATNLPPVTIGSSSDLIVGDQVAAIGNPLGELASTLTVGYISAKDRVVTSEGVQINMLQTDAAINPGNSGGPLFNMYGEVVGITSAKYSGTTDSGATIEGIGFAIPTDDVIMMLEDLKNFGYITGGYLGVTVSEVDQETSSLYGLPQGVLVREVTPGSCAEKAGIRTQDIIINLGGNEVTNLNSLSRALNKCKGGQEVSVTVYRNGQKIELTVILDERPRDNASDNKEPEPTEPANPGDGFIYDWFDRFFG